jgi:hypothetical protein
MRTTHRTPSGQHDDTTAMRVLSDRSCADCDVYSTHSTSHAASWSKNGLTESHWGLRMPISMALNRPARLGRYSSWRIFQACAPLNFSAFLTKLRALPLQAWVRMYHKALACVRVSSSGNCASEHSAMVIRPLDVDMIESNPIKPVRASNPVYHDSQCVS